MIDHLVLLSGAVVHGDGRGKVLGFPTANLDVTVPDSAAGIYAAWVRIDGEGDWREATVSIGTNPTFGDVETVRVECFIHDFDEDLYDRPLEAALMVLIRDTQAFASSAELIAQTVRDVEMSRRLLRDAPIPQRFLGVHR